MSTETRNRLAVPAEKLRLVCDAKKVKEALELPPPEVQADALSAIDLGLNMKSDGYEQSHYNIMVVGSANTGRTAKTVAHLRRRAAKISFVPSDVVCLYNFDDRRQPLTVMLPGGAGHSLQTQLRIFGKILRLIVGAAVEKLRQTHVKKLDEMIAGAWQKANEEVKKLGFIIVDDDGGEKAMGILSIADPDTAMSREEFEGLSKEQQAEVEKAEHAASVAAIIKTAKDDIKKMTSLAVYRLAQEQKKEIEKVITEELAPLRQLHPDSIELSSFLDGLQKHAIKHAYQEPKQTGGLAELMGASQQANSHKTFLKPFQIGLLVNNAVQENPPVVVAEAPQYSSLFGRLNPQPTEDGQHMTLDQTMIEGGALLQANGGYLVVDLDELLRLSGAVTLHKLLKTVRTRQLDIETRHSFLDAETMLNYRVVGIPLDVRVVAICSRHLAAVLRHHLPEFENLFRIIAEFDSELNVAEAPAAYACFVEMCVASGKLPEFSESAVAKLVEYGMRRTDDQAKVSAEFGIIKDLVTEAAYWAKRQGATAVGPDHVRQAIKARFHRQSLAIRRYQEFHDGAHLLIDFDGAKVGQINGLAVVGRSKELRVGVVLRITARAFAGKEKVVLVQREAKLSGSSSDMAIGVIRGYLSGQYGRKKPLALAAQLCFEQSYGSIDGDSATLAEMIALVSAVTELPVDQRLAITGSMNQHGEAQSIGGVNEKIEGHFGSIKRRVGLRSGHGVVIPRTNLNNLMLDEEVVEAQRQGLYQVYAVSHLDEALEIFLGRPAAEIHQLMQKKLTKLGDTEGRNASGWFKRLFG